MPTNGDDYITGTNGPDSINGLDGDDTIWGQGGNDTLDGGTGHDALFGSAGDDTYILDSTGDGIFENANEGNDTVYSSVSYTLPANVENLYLTGTAHINGTGNALNNVITGNAGNNIIDGGAGADTMGGAAGDDLYVVDNAGDRIIDTSGTDGVYATVSYSLANAAGVENLALAGSATVGEGNGLDNRIIGNGAGNFLNGYGGNDTLSGGTGSDVYFATGGFGSDTIVETDPSGADVDKLSFGNATYNQLWFKQLGDNLEISVVGSTDKVTVQDWFATGDNHQIELTLDAGGAHALASSQVGGLVSALASFAPQDLSSNATLVAARDAAWVTA